MQSVSRPSGAVPFLLGRPLWPLPPLDRTVTHGWDYPWMGLPLDGITPGWDYPWMGLPLDGIAPGWDYPWMGLPLDGITPGWDYPWMGLPLDGIAPGWDFQPLASWVVGAARAI
jgi:hypothetical protein